jgi:hypothetical protein
MAIFVEGGGGAESQKRVLRVGFDTFLGPLKQLAAERGKSFRVVLCGSRNEAYKAFTNERRFEPGTLSFLLVDSEEILATDVKQHLSRCETHWDLRNIPEAGLYLMATTMETWIVSDRAALANFYGQRLAVGALSSNRDIEQVSKNDICQQLDAATKNTGLEDITKCAMRLSCSLS